VVQMTKLTPGEYVLTLHAPPQSNPAKVRPAVVGIRPPDTGPPAEVVRKYLQLATGRSEVPTAGQDTRGRPPANREPSEEDETPEEEEQGPEGGGR
jgi:hypothetical protein